MAEHPPDTHKGACFCGAIQIEVSGDAIAQGYCHCDDCRDWSGAPVTAYTLWPSDAVTIATGADKIGRYSKFGKATRCRCTNCGGSVMAEIPEAGLVDVFAYVFEDFDFAPAAHVNYGLRVLDMPDGLPKFRDLPVEAGGSGELVDD